MNTFEIVRTNKNTKAHIIKKDDGVFCGRVFEKNYKKETVVWERFKAKELNDLNLCEKCKRQAHYILSQPLTNKANFSDHTEHLIDAFGQMMHNISAHLQGEDSSTEKPTNDARKLGGYHFIPNSIHNTLSALSVTKTFFTHQNQSSFNKTFIDVGCGVGNIILFASQYFRKTDGIEIDKKTITLAKMLLNSRHRIYKMNILDFDKYNEYDVIYYYCPFLNSKEQIKLEKKIENECKVGTVIIAMLKKDHTIYKDDRFLHLYNGMVYVKIKE